MSAKADFLYFVVLFGKLLRGRWCKSGSLTEKNVMNEIKSQRNIRQETTRKPTKTQKSLLEETGFFDDFFSLKKKAFFDKNQEFAI